MKLSVDRPETMFYITSMNMRLDPKKLIAARGERTLREAAELVGINHSHLWKLEKGLTGQSERTFPLATALRIAQAYGMESFLELCIDSQEKGKRARQKNLTTV